MRHSVAQVLRHLFSGSERVTSQEVRLSDADRASLRKQLPSTSPGPSRTVYVGTTAGRVDGFVLIEDVTTEGGSIRVACLLSPAGTLRQLEVMHHGGGHTEAIIEEAFLRQFQGATAQTPLRTGLDITAPPHGATAARALSQSVRGVLVAFTLLQPQLSTLPPAAQPATRPHAP